MAATAALLAGVTPEADAQTDRASYGITAAAFGWHDGHEEQALGAVVQFAPAPWLTLGAVPTLLRVAGPADDPARVGLADLPVFIGVVHGFAAPWRPTFGIAGVASLPTGDASQGLGRGQSLVSAEGTVAVSPISALMLRAGASRLLRAGDSLAHGIPTTALLGDAVLLANSRTNLSVGYVLELRGGAPAGYEPARVINATIVHALAGRTALSVSAGRMLRGVGPTWSFSVGIGTAFAGLSPVGATSPGARSTGGVMRPADGGLLPIGGTSCRLSIAC
jgi:hypothetical protein